MSIEIGDVIVFSVPLLQQIADDEPDPVPVRVKEIRERPDGTKVLVLAWADFVSYHPDFPEALQLKVTRLFARDIDLAAYELSVRLFLSEVEQELAQVQALSAETAVA